MIKYALFSAGRFLAKHEFIATQATNPPIYALLLFGIPFLMACSLTTYFGF